MKRFNLLTFIFIMILATGCSKTVLNSGNQVFNFEQFENVMNDKGYKFEIIDAEQDFIPTIRKRIILDNEAIDIYLFDNENQMEKEARYIDKSGCSYLNEDKSVKVSWVSLPHFYKRGSLIVQYIGEDEKIISDLKDILGEQFAGYQNRKYITNKELNGENIPMELDLVSGEYRAMWKESYNYDKPILIDNLTDFAEFLKNHPAQSTNEDILHQNYNDEFFKQSIIYAYIKSEGSGSIKITAKRAELNEVSLKLFVERIVPEEGTTDMATRVSLFGIKRSDNKNVKAVEVIILN